MKTDHILQARCLLSRSSLSCLHREYMGYVFARLHDPRKPDQATNAAVLQAVSVIFSGRFPLLGDTHELTR